jgi:hypothetical protein
MKRIKRFSFVVILLVSSIAFSSVAMAWGPKPHTPSTTYCPTQGDHNGGNTAGAPLDGGLLAILTVAGIAYVGARKKKKNAE